MCPPVLGRRSEDTKWQRYEEWLGGAEKSRLLPAALQAAAAEKSIPYIDTSSFVKPSDKDPIHLPAIMHDKLGLGMADYILELPSHK